jgi:tetratricopeptide (TPR) repeat protein
MPGDWFRNERWSPEIEREFYAKLKRSRGQRAQYLRIQAYSLVKTEPLVALRLIDEYFATKDTSFVAAAYRDQAAALVALGRVTEAIEAHRRSIEWAATHPGFETSSRLELPLLIATRKLAEHYDLAMELLESRDLRLVFPLEVFLHACSLAMIHSERGETLQALECAQLALKAAETSQSPLSRHPGLGLVDDRFAAEVQRMERLVAAKGFKDSEQSGALTWLSKKVRWL